ncbi:MAG TPA: universal stress protein [Verrucomicrobiae bacterium]|nr:universal stress protein [Verrucomicrobiae bacterium]
MLEKILVPSDLSDESNSVIPHAVTLAQAFHSKIYLLHVMDPASLKKPENLVDFPKLTRMLALDVGAPDLPPLRKSVSIAKMYLYEKDRAGAIAESAHGKKVDLVCMASNNGGVSLAWWSVGSVIESVLDSTTCHVLCIRGRKLKEKDWKRPRFKHVLWLAELGAAGAEAFVKVLPLVQKFESVLHVFPLVKGWAHGSMEHNPLREVAKIHPAQTNILLFAKPDKRLRNLLDFVNKTRIDLIVMTPRTRARFSNRLLNDVLVKLLRVTDSPVLMLR